MILIENRELLIPNNERYIGTTQDDASENRQFRVRRLSQSGVDMANLTFRMDLTYPESRKVYSFTASSSRAGRMVNVNARAWTKHYSDAGTYVFTYTDGSWTYGGEAVTLSDIGVLIHFAPAAGDTVTVIVEITETENDTVLLDKDVTDEYINLTWNITDNQLSIPGVVHISLRASDEVGAVRWASYQATIFVEKNGYVPSDNVASLSEMEQLENLLSGDIAAFEDALDASKQYEYDSEAWAVGERNGIAVEKGDATYENNAKYYSSVSKSWADDAETSEANAAKSAEQSEASAKRAENMIDDTQVTTGKAYSSAKVVELVPTKVSQLSNDSDYVNQTELIDATGEWATGVLPAGDKTVTIACAGMTADSIVSIYTSVWGVSPSLATIAEGSVTLTFEAQTADVNVKVRWQ